MILRDFQKRAIRDLINSFNINKKEVILKSCTGSGKTIILTNFIDSFIKENSGYVFLWFTPGKGNLEEQSKEKMDKYIHNSSTKLLYEVLNTGLNQNDVCFINWELITKKGNTSLRDGDRANFLDLINSAHRNGLKFIVIVDEEHVNDTVKADEILTITKADKIIRSSATPKNYSDPILIEIPEEEVIADGLIKKQIIINEDFQSGVSVESQVGYLLEKAIQKQYELKSAFLRSGAKINPLILIQVPNKNDSLIYEVERYLEKFHVAYDNRLLSIWLSNRKENLEDIENNNAKPIALIIKQAVATGWDCPRAQILVKLRDNMSEVFEIQTIGRIRRMPQAKHYGSDLLDSSYIYTLDEKFVDNVKLYTGKRALEAKRILLKSDFIDLKFPKETKNELNGLLDIRVSLKSISNFLREKYSLEGRSPTNKIKLEAYGYIFESNIVKSTSTGSIHTLTKEEFDSLSSIGMIEPLNTHIHGREYHHIIADIASKISMDYNSLNQIVRRILDKNYRDDGNKILALEPRMVYSFVINNRYRLKEDLREALSSILIYYENALKLEGVKTDLITLPKECIFTYDGKNRLQREYQKNVYNSYLSSAEIRSTSEKEFEKFCETQPNIIWWYKNGDKGTEYLSIIYLDNSGKQKSFYPDYILEDKNGQVWIIETKGGFSRSGESEDIDLFSPIKFDVLKGFLKKHDFKGGFVRKDKNSNELFICSNEYSHDINDTNWQFLGDVLNG